MTSKAEIGIICDEIDKIISAAKMSPLPTTSPRGVQQATEDTRRHRVQRAAARRAQTPQAYVALGLQYTVYLLRSFVGLDKIIQQRRRARAGLQAKAEKGSLNAVMTSLTPGLSSLKTSCASAISEFVGRLRSRGAAELEQEDLALILKGPKTPCCALIIYVRQTISSWFSAFVSGVAEAMRKISVVCVRSWVFRG